MMVKSVDRGKPCVLVFVRFLNKDMVVVSEEFFQSFNCIGKQV
jgi:hypothetical protein